jgi:transcriptional regulator with GAF, ATPase, and Fis domain
LLELATELHSESGEPRAQLRSVSHRAFHEYRSGNSRAAADWYRQAVAIAERHGLTDRLANAALSYGAACHQNGDWAEALSSYERGLRAAVALGQTSNEVTLRFNLAKLHADIGVFDRADADAQRARVLAERAGLSFFVAAALTVSGEIALARGDASGATAAFERARATFEREGARREEVEVMLHLCDAHRTRGDFKPAEAILERADAMTRALQAPDVEARSLLARGRLFGAVGKRDQARAALERAQTLASRVGQQTLEAEVASALAVAWGHDGADALAQRYRAAAREALERIAASLPSHQRAAFWAHPSRRDVSNAARPSRDDPPLVDKLRRLLDINKKLNSSLTANEVLSRTMDAAVELTGAERGFLILRGASESGAGELDEMTVAIARNIDREQIGKRHLKYSRTIAERTIQTGEPVITVDAESDERFSENESVHAMRLKSVLCVPIRGKESTLGALYLDNRFRSGTFSADDLELLVAFGDQVAIALTNARLHDELGRRAAELEAERRRVQELMQAQAQHIDRLAEQVREKQEILEHRYDYSSIVGRGPRMQALLATLDRVIDTAVTVLVEGESGTGKELVARAIHYNGPRRQGPFVTINCGAVAPTLLESELFGHVRGAFTGADRDREGLLVAGSGGTVFLDEVGEMGLDMQVKLLRVLQEREVRPVGASRVVPIDVRLVCATNRRLRDEVAAGRFREDLFYRIGVVEVELPPLRHRTDDLPELVHHLLARLASQLGRPTPRVSRAAMKRLLAHGWPGNVRELENVLTNALLLSEQGQQLAPTDFNLPTSAAPAEATFSSRTQYERTERERIHTLLCAHRWNVAEVSRVLGMPRATLYRKLKRYGIEAGPSRP